MTEEILTCLFCMVSLLIYSLFGTNLNNIDKVTVACVSDVYNNKINKYLFYYYTSETQAR